jgi:hypothetical protein
MVVCFVDESNRIDIIKYYIRFFYVLLFVCQFVFVLANNFSFAFLRSLQAKAPR